MARAKPLEIEVSGTGKAPTYEECVRRVAAATSILARIAARLDHAPTNPPNAEAAADGRER